MRKILRKAMTILGSTALIGMTVGAAAAASYPAPFTSNTAIVVGASAAPSDNIAASSIASNLDAAAAGAVTAVTTGETRSLASGSDLLYMNDELNENIATLTKSDLPTVLADGTFTDDSGTDYDFEQTLVVGDHPDNHFAFSNSDNDLDDPTLILELSDSSANVIYNLTATFNKAVAFNATDSEGEEITIFGKTYTVGTATDGDTLVLLGGASGTIVNVGETATMVVDGISYDVSLTGLSSATVTVASVSVNGETKTFTEGQTKAIGGVDVYVKTVFRTGDDAGYAEVQLGADKLTLESGNAVQTGSDNDDIEGTLVTLTPATSIGVAALTGITIGVAAEDNDNNHLLAGGSFIDPVFGSVVVNFDGIVNGPTFSGEKDIAGTSLEIKKGGNRELQLELTDNAGNIDTIPFTYNAALSDDDSKVIEIVEGASIAKDEYFILNSGTNQHFMQLTKLSMSATAANSDVAMKDLLSGTTYTFDNHDFSSSGYPATILGQTYTITNDSLTTVTVVSSDYSTKISVFPYIELVSGEDTRVAFTDEIEVFTDATNGTGDDKTVVLPSGEVAVAFTNSSVTDCVTTLTVTGGSVYTLSNATTEDTILVGAVDYVINAIDSVANDDECTALDVDFALEATQAVSGDVQETDPAILFVEDEDKSETTTTTKNAVVVATSDDTSYSTVESPVFTGTYDTQTWDNTDFTGWLTNYGTYVWKDTGDSNQNFVGLSYPDDIMYAEVSVSEGETATASEAGVITVMDDAVSTVAGKNLVVVGGSAINSVAAELLGAAYSEATFTSATDVAAGEFLIQSFARSGKTALLVAGYNAADTEKAVTYLLNNVISTTTGTKYKGTSATEASLVVA